MKPENFNYKIDKLLLDGFNSKSNDYLTTYDLIKSNKKHKLIFKNGILNLYSALINEIRKINNNYLICGYDGKILIKLPSKINDKIIALGNHFVPNSKSIYVKRRAKNRKIILDTIKSLGVKINYGKKEDTINSFLLSDLIKNIFVYDIPWKPLKNDELKILDNKYTIY